MNIKTYCERMKEYRGNQGIFRYLGTGYIVLKFIILGMGIYIITLKEDIFWVIGGLLIGYAIGVTIADIRRLILLKYTFQFQKEIIDWAKVDKIINGENSEQKDARDGVPPPQI